MIESNRKGSAEKLNKEYSEFEVGKCKVFLSHHLYAILTISPLSLDLKGIEGDFGDFLMELDDLVDSVNEAKSTKPSKSASKTEKAAKRAIDADGPASKSAKIVDRTEHSRGDIATDMVNDDEEEEGDEGDVGSQDENDGEGESSEASREYGVSDTEDSASDDDDDEGDEGDADQSAELDKYTYQPSRGEDIYGRVTDPSLTPSTQKYIPPSRRLQLDSQREDVVALKQRVTMLMNKLSEQTREYVVKELRSAFSAHSKYECIEVLVQNIYAMSCSRASVSGFLPLQVSVVAALYVVVGTDVGAVCIEKSLGKLLDSLVEIHVHGEGEGNKLPHNFLMVLVYLYNFKVLHHTLISDILLALCDIHTPAHTPSHTPSHALSHTPSSSSSSSSIAAYTTSTILQRCSITYRLELVELLLLHAGHALRQDDLPSLLLAIQHLKATQAQMGAATHTDEGETTTSPLPSSRFLYMLQLLTDLKQGKAKHSMQAIADSIKQHRKAISAIKLHAQRNVQTNPLRVSFQDLVMAGERGRWWITGASFNNNSSSTDRAESATSVTSKTIPVPLSSAGKSLQAQADKALDKLSSKLQLKTSLRRSILSFLLLSRDIHDAFEKICGLSTQNKEDREVVRVLLECCGKEPSYNPFYAELIKMLCESSRQYKMSLTYAFYDIFKLLPEHSLAKDTKYISNLAQLLADLVLAFTLPLVVLRPFDLESMQEPSGCVFLSVFFVTLCKADVSQEAFLNVFDRLSTSKDVAEVHGHVFYFLEVSLHVWCMIYDVWCVVYGMLHSR
ncbi:hypothetical protein EON64_06540 [archaeon]|nr:MAG: hypothetical protein EON64_06540 [archaeon]